MYCFEGLMGAGIAQLAAQNGVKASLVPNLATLRTSPANLAHETLPFHRLFLQTHHNLQ